MVQFLNKWVHHQTLSVVTIAALLKEEKTYLDLTLFVQFLCSLQQDRKNQHPTKKTNPNC